MDIDYDLENSPLRIRTNSVVGSDDKLKVRFKTADGEVAGEVTISLKSTPQYILDHCYTSWTDFPTDLPSETVKIWRITLFKTSDIRLQIQCNNKKVLNVVISAGACEDSGWGTIWNQDVQKIYFHPNDEASDYYRPGK